MKGNPPFSFCPRCGARLSRRRVGEQERLACADDCGFVHWDNPVPVLAAIVEHDGEIVLANNHAWAPDMFGLVTGYLEAGESPEQGILREVKEELGLAAHIVNLVGVYAFAHMNQVIMAWHVRGDGVINLGAELRAIRRVAPENLRPWDFGTGPAVRDWLARRGAGDP